MEGEVTEVVEDFLDKEQQHLQKEKLSLSIFFFFFFMDT